MSVIPCVGGKGRNTPTKEKKKKGVQGMEACKPLKEGGKSSKNLESFLTAALPKTESCQRSKSSSRRPQASKGGERRENAISSGER